MGGHNLPQYRPGHLLRGFLIMRYNVWLLREDGSPSPVGPSQITASDLVSAQHLAAGTLEELQAEAVLIGWSVKTVTEAY